MGDVIAIGEGKKPRGKKGRSTLCQNGHHRWEVDKGTRFDSQKGKLVTRERCTRCGKTRVKGS